jgi:hypothetical protein
MTKAHLYVSSPAPYKFLRFKNDGNCLHYMNASASILEDL